MNFRVLRDEGDTVIVGWEPGSPGFLISGEGSSRKSLAGPTIQRSKDFPPCNTRIKKAASYTLEELGVVATHHYPEAPPPPPPAGKPTWSGDFETGNLSQWGGLEYAGTFDGTPPVSERVIVAKTIDGIRPADGEYLAKFITKAGDQYGGSSGWRTNFRQHQPLRLIDPGTDHWFTWAVLLPSSYPGDGASPFQTGPEFHQSKAPYVDVTGSAPFHFIARPDRFYVDVFGGRDRETIRYVTEEFAHGYARNVWHVFAMRYRHGLTDGAFELHYAPKGKPLQQIVSKTGIGTMYEQTRNSFMFGLYRKAVGTGDMIAYFDGVREYPDRDSALAYARHLAA